MKRDFYNYFVPIIILSLIGIVCIFCSKSIISNYDIFLKKQIIYLLIGIFLLVVLYKMNFIIINKYSLVFYVISILLLIYVLFFGSVINGSRSWISLFGLSFQPSEFVKIALVLCFNKYIKSRYGLLKCFILLLIPSILTFLQPDTGTVIFYLVIFFSIFVSIGLKKRYYFLLFGLSLLCIGIYFYLYFFQSDLFINVFGTSFFYRTDRIINFASGSGYQIENALIGIGNGGLFGNLTKYVIYIPEAITDFMFANSLIVIGFIGGLAIILLFFYIDVCLIKDIKCCNNKYFIIGLLGVFLYQQIQHIYMNIGLLPITGITLPFVSYGGSSLISYFILFGILFNIKKTVFENSY